MIQLVTALSVNIEIFVALNKTKWNQNEIKMNISSKEKVVETQIVNWTTI
jgi:hypothetical protein